MKKKWNPRYFYWALMLGIMVIIFILSHQPGEVSTKISNQVASTLQVESQERYAYMSLSAQPLLAGLSLRKYAHLILYGCLGFSAFLVMKDSRMCWWKKLLATIGICFVYSLSDELHQYFIPGRGASLKDIRIDAMGYGVVIIVSTLVLMCKKRIVYMKEN